MRVVSAIGKSSNAGTVTFLKSNREPGVTILDVQPSMGDAKQFGIAGQVRLLDRQCLEFSSGGPYDVITLPERVARSLGKPPDKPKRRPRR
jgi:hypothetical protein